MKVYVDPEKEYSGRIEFETLEELVTIKRALEVFQDYKRNINDEIGVISLDGKLESFDYDKITYLGETHSL